jgi:hypothetical protein
MWHLKHKWNPNLNISKSFSIKISQSVFKQNPLNPFWLKIPQADSNSNPGVFDIL